MQLIYIVILSATGYCYSIIYIIFLVAGVRKIRARDTIGPIRVSHDQFVFLLFLVILCDLYY